MITVSLTYYKTSPEKTNTGIKHVLWEVITDKNEKVYDWGFAEWLGDAWGDSGADLPEGYSISVHSWANTLDPTVLVSSIVL